MKTKRTNETERWCECANTEPLAGELPIPLVGLRITPGDCFFGWWVRFDGEHSHDCVTGQSRFAERLVTVAAKGDGAIREVVRTAIAGMLAHEVFRYNGYGIRVPDWWLSWGNRLEEIRRSGDWHHRQTTWFPEPFPLEFRERRDDPVLFCPCRIEAVAVEWAGRMFRKYLPTIYTSEELWYFHAYGTPTSAHAAAVENFARTLRNLTPAEFIGGP
jgi:hypothetical protein